MTILDQITDMTAHFEQKYGCKPQRIVVSAAVNIALLRELTHNCLSPSTGDRLYGMEYRIDKSLPPETVQLWADPPTEERRRAGVVLH
jgi:hypothetical protein